MEKIAIRADGNFEVGLGHLIRCFALAEMLKDRFEVDFFCVTIPENILSSFNKSGYRVNIIKSDFEMSDFNSSHRLIVLDGYHFTSEYQLFLKNIGFKLICIDDLYEIDFYADLIINHAPTALKEKYKHQYYTDFALGLDFALLRPMFLKAAVIKREINTIQSVFICFGGADSKNYTLKVIEACVRNLKFKQINVVTGASFQYIDTIKRISDNRIKHFHSINENEMLEIMIVSDLAIVPSSGILFEVLSVGCKVASGYYVDNQKGIYDGFKQLNAFIDLDSFSDLSMIENIKIEDFEKTSKNLIDGFSGNRLREKIIKLIN